MRVCVLTTAHNASDVRIFEKEVLALNCIENLEIYYVAYGCLQNKFNNFISLGRKPTRRLYRIMKAFYLPWKIALQCRPKVWHIHDPELIPFGIAMSLFGKKVIWDAHEDYFHQFSREVNYREYIPNKLQATINLIMNFLLSKIDNYADVIIAATETVASKYSNNNIYIVGNESLVHNFNQASPDFKSNNVLFIGALSSQQCFRDVVMAIKSLPNINLVVAGQNDDEESQFAQEELGDRYHHLGWVNQSLLAEVISNSAIGLMTYFNSDLYQRPVSPTKFYEFAASGLPILATPTFANIQLINQANCGLVMQDFDQKSIAIAIKKMLADEDEWTRWSHSGKKWANSFGNWEMSKNNLIKAYKSISNK